jgi:hypothetical protein
LEDYERNKEIFGWCPGAGAAVVANIIFCLPGHWVVVRWYWVLSRVVDGAFLEFFLRDILAASDLPFFAGFVSQLGGMLWCASMTVCLFSLLVLCRQDGNLAASKRLLLQAGILTGVLLVDDSFSFS